MGGEWWDEWAEVGPDAIVMCAPDLTKSRRDDWAAVLTDPTTGLAAFLAAGSPIRTTDRAGAGTRGTRRWPGLSGGCLLVWR